MVLAQAVSAKLEDGNLKAAIRLLISDDAPAVPSKEGLAKLQQKHLPATLDASTLPAPPTNSNLFVAESDVKKALLSFPAGFSGGPDGLRPQHAKDMINCREAGAELLSALTAFVNVLLAGRCPKQIAPIFFGGRLIALDKKSGGVRPIAIGLTLRRLAAKCANTVGVARLTSYFTPRQLGVGVPGGCEAAIHSARRFLQSMPVGHVLVKLDFTNAFNSLHREDMLLAIRDRLPELYAFCLSAYVQPSILFYGPYTLLSNEGPQQGDPIGPLMFSNAVHPLLESLGSELTEGYLDDLTLGGLQSVVVADIQQVMKIGMAMGLVLNVSKCEVITDPGTAIIDPLLLSFQRLATTDCSLLGAPLFHGSALDSAWADRCADMTRAAARLTRIASQDALILLRASFSAPRVQHLLRCSPSVDHVALDKFDNLLRSAIGRITNCDLSDSQWLQATLTIKEGGLGVRRVASLALPAFLASAVSSLPLQDAILSSGCGQQDTFLAAYQTTWSSMYGPPPVSSSLHKQSVWDKPGMLCDKARVVAGLNSERQKASFLAASSRHSGDWLMALPITACGLKLDDEAVRVAVALRLGLDLCGPHPCALCSSPVDAWGTHAFVCKHAPGRISRHHVINDSFARAFASAGVPVKKEPSGLLLNDSKRPDGLTLIPWRAGKPLAWDVTVAATHADSYIRASSSAAGAAAEMAATRKMNKYSDLPTSVIFQPLAFETLGPINESAIDCMIDLGHRLSANSGEAKETFFLFQRLSIIIQRFNAILLHDTFGADVDPDP